MPVTSRIKATCFLRVKASDYAGYKQNQSYMFPESQGFGLCRLQAESKLTCFLRVKASDYAGYKQNQSYMFQFIPNQLETGDEIVRPCDRHTNETVTLRKYVTKHEKTRKWMVEFLRKFENCVIKIARDNSILITKSINLQLFTLIFYGVGGPLWWRF